MTLLCYDIFITPLGWAAALVSPKGIRALTFQASPQEAVEGLGPELDYAEQDADALKQVRQAVDDYCQGDFGPLGNLALDVEDAPPFFRAAWQACRTIPMGETRSYGWLAEAAGRPRAARAAGQAMAHNRVALAIPCHRVVGSNGGLGGYGMGGLLVKAKLLELERHAHQVAS